MRIGLSLSGGGFRATVFHLGVLARMALENRLEEVTVVSTVSGGSMCGALVHLLGGMRWPNSHQYIERLPLAREIITAQDLELGLAWRALRAPLSILEPRANYLSELMQKQWGFTPRLCDLPNSTRWLINATTYETGKNWRFESFRMGDYVFGYTNDTNLPAAEAVAASCGFPGLIGALVLNTAGRHWFQYPNSHAEVEQLDAVEAAAFQTRPIEPAVKFVHLWDGGVYDNFGMEGVFDIGSGMRKNIEFLVVSDASGPLGMETYQPGSGSLMRIVWVMMDQVRAVRTRALLSSIVDHHEPGVLLRTDGSCTDILQGMSDQAQAAALLLQCQDEKEQARAGMFPTVLRRLTDDEFNLLFRHGYEMANCALFLYGPEQKSFIAYHDSPWSAWA